MKTIGAPGRQLSYAELGAGPPVLFLHSTGMSAAQWTPIAKGLASSYRTLAANLYGVGATSPWSSSSGPTLSDQAELVSALLAELTHPVFIVGHSYGGAVALKLALRDPSSVRALILIEPTIPSLLRERRFERYERELVGVSSEIRQLVHAGRGLDAARAFIRYWGGDGFWTLIPDTFREQFAARIRDVAEGEWDSLFEDEARAQDFSRLDIPTLLVNGDASAQPSLVICEALAEAMPRAARQVVASAGHMLPITHAQELKALILGMLESEAASSTREKRALP